MDYFLLKLALSFVIGGLYTGLTVLVAEKYGSKLGGLATGMPSRTVLTLLFIGWTQSTSAALKAVPIMPVALAVNALFVVAFIGLYKHGEKIAFGVATLLWFSCTLPLAFSNFNNLLLSLVLAIPNFVIGLLLLKKYPHRKLEKTIVTRSLFIKRCLIAGTVVAASVLLGRIMGPLWGGLAASFPVTYTSSLFMIARNYGIEFTSAVARTMPYGTMGNVMFTASFYLLTPMIGLALGTLAAYTLSLLVVAGIYKVFLSEKMITS